MIYFLQTNNADVGIIGLQGFDNALNPDSTPTDPLGQ